MVTDEGSKVTQFGPSGNGTRLCAFDLAGLRLTVTPSDPVANDAALAWANDLSRLGETLIAERARADALARDLEAARAALPPTQPAQLLGPGFVRFCGEEMWLLNRRGRGFGEFGLLIVGGWDDLFRRFNVRVTDHGADQHGPWWQVDNVRSAPRAA